EPEKPEFKEEADDSANDPKRTWDYSVLKAAGHPRVLMKEADFADLKTKVTSGRFENKTLYKMHKLTLDLADDYCASSEVLKYELDSGGKRLLGQSRNALKRLFACAYAYRLTGKAKYLQKAQADLKTVCSFQDWHPSHYLDVGEMALGVAVAYDWLYYDLSYEDRLRTRRALSTYAVGTAPGKGFYTSEGNWNQVCNAGVMAAAIAVYEKDKLRSVNVIEEGVASNARMMKGIYSPDGNYTEGYDYWGYGTGFQVVILQLLKAAFGDCAGLDETPGFMETAGYMLFMAGPCGKDFSYADGGVGSERPKIGMWWFAAQKKDPSLLLNEMRLYENGLYPSSDEARLLPMVPCFLKDANLDDVSSARPSKDIWYGRGVTPVVMIHTGWEFDRNDMYVGIKGGKAGAGHGHMDAGSFVFDSQGVRWSMDYTRPSYSSIEQALSSAGGNFWAMTQNSLRWDVTKMNNLVHSTLTCTNSDGSVANKRHVTDHNVAGSATLETVIDEPSRLGATLDMTAPLSDAVAKAERTITLEGNKVLKIVDVITAKAGMDADVQWRMLTPASVSVSGDVETLTQSGRTLYLKASSDSSDAPVTLTTWSPARDKSWSSQSWDTGLSGTVAGFTVSVPAGRTVTLTTLLTPDK
ncbi:MAG: heparinase II/III family protein, partial [Bacteroidales bacterium]|nr:heparinase II/III family protein [Bacteroidales bacterium]